MKDHSDPIVFPPLIPITAFATGVLLEKLHPLDGVFGAEARTPLRVLGAVVFLAGAAGFVWMVRSMKAARTPIHNAKTPTALVERGPFAFTRNPMYLFGAVAYAGMALLQMQLWSLALLPIVQVLTHYGVVLREEAFLERHFGETYLHYKTRVPRWLGFRRAASTARVV